MSDRRTPSGVTEWVRRSYQHTVEVDKEPDEGPGVVVYFLYKGTFCYHGTGENLYWAVKDAQDKARRCLSCGQRLPEKSTDEG